MASADFTDKEQRKDFKATHEAEKNTIIEVKFRSVDAVILSPSPGNPAIVKKEEGTAILELMILCKVDNLQAGETAFHLRTSSWEMKDKCSYLHNTAIWKTYLKNKDTVNLSRAYKKSVEIFGKGKEGKDTKDKNFKLKLAHCNIYPWILEAYEGYEYIYKISVDIGYYKGLYNIWWVTKSDYHRLKEKYRWLNDNKQIQQHSHNKLFSSEEHKTELKEYGGDIQEDKDENIQAAIYHPFYVTDKKELNIGHITDIHLDTRMDIYSQSVASVIEVEENCPDKSLRFKDGKRDAKNKEFYNPSGKKIADFNEIFTDISERLLQEGADALVITGDLIDYNQGLHYPQTYHKQEERPGKAWDSLDKTGEHKDNRNWFLFYKKILQLYDKYQKPIFTILGNHDYVKHAMAPYPLQGKLWNGVYDQNLTLYESALVFGPGFDDFKEFAGNLIEHIDCVKWYSLFINPFADYCVEYGDQSLFMIDWCKDSNVIGPGVESMLPLHEGPGGLHHARHIFSEGKVKQLPIRNYPIYQSWLGTASKIKILFMHPTAVCPRNDISIDQIKYELKWTENELQYGTFDKKRDKILKDVENGRLHIVITGHSHRNIVMELSSYHKDRAKVLASANHVNVVDVSPENLVVATSSGGPLPTYKPGAPLICDCSDYEKGYFYDGAPLFKKLYRYKNGAKEEIKDNKCPDCKMEGGDMAQKRYLRHRPGGNLLEFNDGRVNIRSVFSTKQQAKPRLCVMNDENEVFTGDMVLSGVGSEDDYNDWDMNNPIEIISKKPFTKYGYMDFPDRVQYVTYSGGLLNDKGKFDSVETRNEEDNESEKRVRQTILKDNFDELIQTTKNEEDFIFTRYYYPGNNNLWDREIKITKGWLTKVKDAVIDNTLRRIDWIKDKFDLRDRPDEFDGLLIRFAKYPDFKKRKRVCGY